ncbi:MAG: hypothetical protein FJY77_03440 [Candidatus Altiarchaeales archaeon]|nr:hypothetical protein [Candidatus Altiarchaeales archaeon]
MRLPAGRPLTLEEAELFIKSRENRKLFNGLVQMHGQTSGRGYVAELLMTEGEIIALELAVEDGKQFYGEAALQEIKKLGGSEGDLILVKYSTMEAEKAVEDNKNALLSRRVMLEEFKIRIRQTAKQPDGSGMLSTVKGIFSVSKPTAKGEFKGQFRLESEAKEGWDVKKALIDRIKNRRFGRLTEKILIRKKTENPVESRKFMEGEVVETTIDKLFNLVDKRDKLKIDDKLARELGVGKDKIEEWAVILEEHNLVTINYPAIGEPEIAKKRK